MSLRVWLPLNGDLENKGLDGNITVTNNNATINNNGKIGKCYYFNGSAQYLQLSETLGDIYCGDFSWAVWLKPEDDTRGIIISEYASTGSSNVAFELLANRVIRIYWNGAPDISTGVSIEKDKWSHVTITKKDDTIKVYVNGELKTTRTQTLSDRSSTSKIRIGDDYRGGTSVSYMGYMNDVRIYDHCLSLKQIQQVAKGLVLHYKLDNDGMGGENLALNTHNLDIQSSKNNLNMYVRSGTTRQLRLDGFYEAKGTGSWHGLSFWANQLNLIPGTKVTYSFYIYGNGSARSFSFYPMMFNSSGVRNTSIGFPISIDGGPYTSVNAKTFGSTTATSPEYHYVTFEWNQDVTDFISDGGSIELSIQVHGTWNTGDWACLFAPKVEYGDEPTPWSPARIEKGDSNIIYDSSGYQNDGTIIGSIQINSDSPKYSVSTSFNGSSCIKNNNFNLSGKIWSVSCWYYKSENPTEYEGLFCLSKSSGSDANKKIAAMPNTGRIWYKGESGSLSISKLKIAEWTLLTISCDGTIVKIYENDTLIGSYNAGNEILDANDLVIGARAFSANAESTSLYFTGQISDFRIYVTALSLEDIKELYQTSVLIDRNQNLYVGGVIE